MVSACSSRARQANRASRLRSWLIIDKTNVDRYDIENMYIIVILFWQTIDIEDII